MLSGLLIALTLQNTYPRAMEIVRIDLMGDKAICVDATGNEWEFYEPEDLEEGDIVICTMYDNGTKTILDDEIVDVIWSGYTISEFYKPLEYKVIDK
jgi:hypothetical protein